MNKRIINLQALARIEEERIRQETREYLIGRVAADLEIIDRCGALQAWYRSYEESFLRLFRRDITRDELYMELRK